jgi:demethoxyubiquinone hydroxylase (CLK1/Coq7/Cat5 family)
VRATVKKMAETDIRNLSAEDLSDIMVYRASINNAIESRSMWWKIAHPFKNNAEQKAIKILDEVISINTANEIAAQTIVDGEAIDNANNSIERAINHIEVKPEARAYKKENMKLPFLSENANVKDVSQKIEPSQVNVKSNVKQ